MELGKIIGEGRYRECYEIKGRALVAKFQKPNAHIHPLVQRVLRKRFGTLDMNAIELKMQQGMPSELGPYLPELQLITDHRDSVLLASQPHDYTGHPSKTVRDTGQISNPLFWEHIHRLIEILERSRTECVDVFNDFGDNIVVQQLSEEEWIPAVVDPKKGMEFYPLQRGGLQKMRRRFDRFEQRFHVRPQRKQYRKLFPREKD